MEPGVPGGDAGGVGWTPTPEALERLGLGATTRVSVAGGSEPEEWAPAGAQVDAAAVWLRGHGDGALAGVVGDGWSVPIAPEAAGDAVLLLRSEVSGAPEHVAGRMGTLLRGLSEKQFLRSAATVAPQGVAATAMALARASGQGVRLSGRGWAGSSAGQNAVLVSCAWSAHLALANFVERRTGFPAEAIGRLTGDGEVTRDT